MSEQFQLKHLDQGYVPKALEKAERYRLLNWPEEAESICLDVLDAVPGHQKAIELLVLALADQFLDQGDAPRVKEAMTWTTKLTDGYERVYLEGIIHEREGRAHLIRGFNPSFAYEAFRDAMEAFERAEKLAPPGNQEAALRYNSCARTIQREKLEPRPADTVVLHE